MSQINPFIPAAIQGTHAQSKPSASKERQIRRSQNLGKNSGLSGDELEHQVESPDALHAISDQSDSYHPHKRRDPKAPKKADDDLDVPPRVDFTA